MRHTGGTNMEVEELDVLESELGEVINKTPPPGIFIFFVTSNSKSIFDKQFCHLWGQGKATTPPSLQSATR